MKRFLAGVAGVAAVVILAGWMGAVGSAGEGAEIRLTVRPQAGGTEAAAVEPKTAAEKAPAKAEPSQPAFEKPGPAPAATGFALKDTAGQYLDVYLDGRAVARYMYASDTSTPKKARETYKPYLHILNAEGTAPITKGPGGLFTHHRGIFIGWDKVMVDGERYDLWHMGDRRQEHQKFLAQTAEADRATFTSQVAWNLADGKTIIDEERTHVFHRRPAPTLARVDFISKLKAAVDLSLDGDPEHAGVHYRPADEVEKAATLYVFPKEDTNVKKERDLPWVAETYVLGGKKYSVLQMNDPGNPKGTIWSAYRDYGRFGAFFKKDVKKGETLEVRYAFQVMAGDLPGREALAAEWEAFAHPPPAEAK